MSNPATTFELVWDTTFSVMTGDVTSRSIDELADRIGTAVRDRTGRDLRQVAADAAFAVLAGASATPETVADQVALKVAIA